MRSLDIFFELQNCVKNSSQTSESDEFVNLND